MAADCLSFHSLSRDNGMAAALGVSVVPLVVLGNVKDRRLLPDWVWRAVGAGDRRTNLRPDANTSRRTCIEVVP
jgi:hypothetical protein